ncbi:unnamed protein product, partial [Iphiclides podalirius]
MRCDLCSTHPRGRICTHGSSRCTRGSAYMLTLQTVGGNGFAENAVKTIKKTIKRALYEGEDLNATLIKFLLEYRNCEHATTGVSPAVALQGRRLRGRLDALRPDVVAAVCSKQEQQVARTAGAHREFRVGDAVARDYRTKGSKWAEAIIVKKTGPVSYKVDLGNGVEWRRNVDQVT